VGTKRAESLSSVDDAQLEVALPADGEKDSDEPDRKWLVRLALMNLSSASALHGHPLERLHGPPAGKQTGAGDQQNSLVDAVIALVNSSTQRDAEAGRLRLRARWFLQMLHRSARLVRSAQFETKALRTPRAHDPGELKVITKSKHGMVYAAVASFALSSLVAITALHGETRLGVPSYWAWVLTGLQVLALWVAGRKRSWGWLLGASVQPVWITYAAFTGQLGFIPGCAVSAVVQAHSFLHAQRMGARPRGRHHLITDYGRRSGRSDPGSNPGPPTKPDPATSSEFRTVHLSPCLPLAEPPVGSSCRIQRGRRTAT